MEENMSPIENKVYAAYNGVESEYQEEQLKMMKLRRKSLEAAYNNLNETDSWEDFNRKEYIDGMLRIAQSAY